MKNYRQKKVFVRVDHDGVIIFSTKKKVIDYIMLIENYSKADAEVEFNFRWREIFVD